MRESVLFSNDSDEWETPWWLFEQLRAEFPFMCDVAATSDNTRCEKFYDKKNSAFSHTWEGFCWMNPPYSQVSKWIQRAVHEVQDHGAIVVALIPSRTDTTYWHKYVMQADEIRFIKGRLKFTAGGVIADSNAPFPSSVVVWRCWNGKPTTPLIGTIRR